MVRAAGVVVVIATGRSPWGARDICSDLGLTGPQITMNGGLFGAPVTGEIVWAHRLGPEEVREHLAFARLLGIRPLLSFTDGHVAESSPDSIGAGGIPDFAAGPTLRTVDSLDEVAGDGPIRIYLPTRPEMHSYAVAAARAQFAGRASIVCNDDAGLELLRPATNKGEALRAVAARLGVARHETAAVGDGPNDLEMLLWAGRSAAMRPAPRAVKNAANLVVPSSSADGVLVALGRFFPGLTLPSGGPDDRRLGGAGVRRESRSDRDFPAPLTGSAA